MTTSTSSRTGAPRVIQFPHPGFEYSGGQRAKYSHTPGAARKDPAGVMGWKPGNSTHDRKYMAVPGSVMPTPAAGIETGVLLGFWGEWEAPSSWVRLPTPVADYHPSAVHTPLLPATADPGSRQNTDPLVFGDAFRYTNCKMYRKAMQGMPAGSIVLFGRGMQVHGEAQYVLDTCFVVDEQEPSIEAGPGDELEHGRDLLTDVVVAPLRTESSRGHTRITPYRGRVPAPGSERPFSFFPAVRHESRPAGFARPVLHPTGALEGLLTRTLTMGMKPTTVDPARAVEVWHEVVEQVLDQGCELGVHAEAPAPGSLEAVLAAR